MKKKTAYIQLRKCKSDWWKWYLLVDGTVVEDGTYEYASSSTARANAVEQAARMNLIIVCQRQAT